MVCASPATANQLSQDTASGVYGGAIAEYGSADIGFISARVTRGINPTGTGGSLGAFSEFNALENGVVNVDFNSPAQSVGTNSYTFGSDDIVYSYSGSSGIRNNNWAPSGANGEYNSSNYLAAFQGNDITVDLSRDLNYFGIDWGALSSGNNFAFYSDDQLLSAFTYEDINPEAVVQASQHGGQNNAYLHFYANDAQGTFNRIVISQTQGGGFETDNHSLRFGESAFDYQTQSEQAAAVIASGAPISAASAEDVPFEVETTLGLIFLSLGWFGHRLRTKHHERNSAIA